MSRVHAADPTLRRLRLAGHVELCRLSRAQQAELILELGTSRFLVELHVDKLQLDDGSARALASLLSLEPLNAPRCPLLERLSAERNCFTDGGALAICASLAGNGRLAELSLADQLRPFAQATVRAFCEMLEGSPDESSGEAARANFTLRRLNLGRFTDPANALRQRLAKLTMRNTDLGRQARARAAPPAPPAEIDGGGAGGVRAPGLDAGEGSSGSPADACVLPLSAHLRETAKGILHVVSGMTARHRLIDWHAEAARLAASLPPLASRLTAQAPPTSTGARAGAPAPCGLTLALSSDLAFANASADARAAFLGALATNTTITRAELANIRLTDSDLVLLAGALQSNHTLTVLNVESNHIAMGAEALAAMAALLSSSRTLSEVRMAEQHGCRGWSLAAEEQLAQAIEQNSHGCLVKLTLASSLSARARDTISRCTMRNARARRLSGFAASSGIAGASATGAAAVGSGAVDAMAAAAPPPRLGSSAPATCVAAAAAAEPLLRSGQASRQPCVACATSSASKSNGIFPLPPEPPPEGTPTGGAPPSRQPAVLVRRVSPSSRRIARRPSASARAAGDSQNVPPQRQEGEGEGVRAAAALLAAAGKAEHGHAHAPARGPHDSAPNGSCVSPVAELASGGAEGAARADPEAEVDVKATAPHSQLHLSQPQPIENRSARLSVVKVTAPPAAESRKGGPAPMGPPATNHKPSKIALRARDPDTW